MMSNVVPMIIASVYFDDDFMMMMVHCRVYFSMMVLLIYAFYLFHVFSINAHRFEQGKLLSLFFIVKRVKNNKILLFIILT